MPELPEVETIRRSLSDLVDCTIADVTFSAVAPIRHTSPHALQQRLRGQRLEKFGRRGKFLLLHCGDAVLILHLGMSGRLRRADLQSTPPKHTHMTLQLSNARTLRYVDARRFGLITVTDATLHNPCLDHLGPEFDDPHCTPAAFMQSCRRHAKLTLKMALLDQHIVAGIGNIYACEILYEARVSPTRRIGETPDEAFVRIHTAIRTVLTRAIAHGGTSLRDYEDSWGKKGGMKSHLQVYGRDGKSTLDGLWQVVRIVQQGRSTWYAPDVQR